MGQINQTQSVKPIQNKEKEGEENDVDFSMLNDIKNEPTWSSLIDKKRVWSIFSIG